MSRDSKVDRGVLAGWFLSVVFLWLMVTTMAVGEAEAQENPHTESEIVQQLKEMNANLVKVTKAIESSSKGSESELRKIRDELKKVTVEIKRLK